MIDFLEALLVFSTLIFIHELGHFLIAKKRGVRVEEFGFGYPPRLWGKKWKGTLYSFNLVPFGGFVRIDENAFNKKPKKVRGSVLLGGILMNLLLAISLFSLLYFLLGVPQKQGFVKIVAVAKNSPAQKAGIKEGDIVRKIKSNQEFIDFINDNLGKEVKLELKREGKVLSVNVVPRKNPPQNEGALGVVIVDSETIKPVFWQRPFVSLWWGIKETINWIERILLGVVQLFASLLIKKTVPSGLSGPVGIVQVATHVARSGLLALIQFTGILSVNLAVLNFLPIPALDGGRLFFLVTEILTGKKPKPEFERWVHTLGMVFLLLLMLAVTIQDIKRIFSGLPLG